jgi:hypothetical protein
MVRRMRLNVRIWQGFVRWRGFCQTESTSSGDIRTAATTGKRSPSKSRFEKIPSARVRSKCLERTPSRDVRNAARCFLPELSQPRAAPNADLNCIHAVSVLISIPPAASNARSRFPTVSQRKMNAISARSTRCACEWKKKPQRRLSAQAVPKMPAKPSRTCSRNEIPLQDSLGR